MAQKSDTTEVTALDRMVNATNEYLTRHNVKGTDGEVGNYDPSLIGDCCLRILNGAVDSDTGYGIIVTRLYFETSNLL